VKVIFSRKGFDSSAGGCPSPIADGRPISLPIPTTRRSTTTYADLQLGDLVELATHGRIGRNALCHDDPMFAEGSCWFGQAGAAQGHLRRQAVGIGDMFLFFGIFADPDNGDRHHRIFAYLKVVCCDAPGVVEQHPDWNEPPRPHPHVEGEWNANNTIYHGPAAVAARATAALRLTSPNAPVNRWTVPAWLHECGLTYHGRDARWIGQTGLDSARRGQEFVCDIGDNEDAHWWLDSIVREIER
jgi:hypothetical protein